MKKILFVLITIMLFGCREATFSNGCRGDLTDGNIRCLRSLVDEQKRVQDSLQFELRLLQQKFDYECRGEKQ